MPRLHAGDPVVVQTVHVTFLTGEELHTSDPAELGLKMSLAYCYPSGDEPLFDPQYVRAGFHRYSLDLLLGPLALPRTITCTWPSRMVGPWREITGIVMEGERVSIYSDTARPQTPTMTFAGPKGNDMGRFFCQLATQTCGRIRVEYAHSSRRDHLAHDDYVVLSISTSPGIIGNGVVEFVRDHRRGESYRQLFGWLEGEAMFGRPDQPGNSEYHMWATGQLTVG